MGIIKPFHITCLGVTDTSSSHGGKICYESFVFLIANICIAWFLFKKRSEFEAIYYRDESLFLAAFLAAFLMRKKVFFEIHAVYEKKYRQIKNILAVYFSNGVIAISSGLKRYYQKINKNILISLCSAAEDLWFDHSKSKVDFRKLLQLPMEAFIVGYTGVTGINPNNDYYEIDDVVLSLSHLPKNIIFVVVGELNGNAGWIRDIAKKALVSDRVIFVPWQERSLIPKYLQAFDANLIPKRKKDLVGDSPAKMFPALAARRPIIAGRAECIEEVLTDGFGSIIVDSNTPRGWSDAILKIYSNPELGEKISNNSGITKTKYTWEKRGVAITDFIKNKI